MICSGITTTGGSLSRQMPTEENLLSYHKAGQQHFVKHGGPAMAELQGRPTSTADITHSSPRHLGCRPDEGGGTHGQTDVQTNGTNDQLTPGDSGSVHHSSTLPGGLCRSGSLQQWQNTWDGADRLSLERAADHKKKKKEKSAPWRQLCSNFRSWLQNIILSLKVKCKYI